MKILIKDESPSWAYFLPDNEFEKEELHKALTIKVPQARFSGAYQSGRWDGKHTFIEYRKSRFPSGLLGIVRRALPNVVVKDQRVYPPIKFYVPKLEGLEMRQYQKEAVLSAFEHRTGLIYAATNAGKSVAMAALIKLLANERVLILIHREEILRQLGAMIEKWTGYEIGEITAGHAARAHKHVNIAMAMTLLNRLDQDDAVLETFLTSRVICVDEVHRAKAETFSSILQRSRAVWRFGFSGTIPAENTYDGMLIRQWLGDVVYNVTNDELIKAHISAEPKMTMIEFNHDIDYPVLNEAVTKKLLDAGRKFPTIWKMKEAVYREVYQKVMMDNIVNNEERNTIAAELVARKYKNKQVLVVVDFIDHGINMERIFKDKFGLRTEFIFGPSPNRISALEKFRDGGLRVLITSSILDEGIDLAQIQMLVLLGGKKSKRQILQRIGRGLRRKEGENVVTIIDFYDKDGKYLERHSKERHRIFMREKFSVDMAVWDDGRIEIVRRDDGQKLGDQMPTDAEAEGEK